MQQRWTARIWLSHRVILWGSGSIDRRAGSNSTVGTSWFAVLEKIDGCMELPSEAADR
jgi:hypothetical protein